MISTRLFRSLAKPKWAAIISPRSFSSSGDVTLDLGADIFATHNCEAPSHIVTTNKEELMKFFKIMYQMRRVIILFLITISHHYIYHPSYRCT